MYILNTNACFTITKSTNDIVLTHGHKSSKVHEIHTFFPFSIDVLLFNPYNYYYKYFPLNFIIVD
jgi:hypothetical protein